MRPSAHYTVKDVLVERVGQIFIENAIKSAPIAVDGDGTDKLDFTYIEDLMQEEKKL